MLVHPKHVPAVVPSWPSLQPFVLPLLQQLRTAAAWLKNEPFFFRPFCSLCLLFKMAAATHAASRAAPAVGGGAGAAATAVTQRVPRSVRLAARYPPKRTFDGVRPTQKIIELLRKEQPQTAPQLWVHCKKAGAHHNDGRFRSLILRPGFPNKPYMKKITRTLVNQGKLIARPTVPNH